MARGQYELPRTRAKPVFGPRRPPVSPSQSSSGSPTSPPATRSPKSSSPCSQSQKSPFNPQRRPVIAFISLFGFKQHTSEIDELKARLRSQATVQDVESANDSTAVFASNPLAVVVTDGALKEATLGQLRLEAVRYVQNGGNVLFTCAPILEEYPSDFASEFFGSGRIGYVDITDVAMCGRIIESACRLWPDSPQQQT